MKFNEFPEIFRGEYNTRYNQFIKTIHWSYDLPLRDWREIFTDHCNIEKLKLIKQFDLIQLYIPIEGIINIIIDYLIK